MAMTTGGGGGQTADINVTPLIDVLLVLLIIFMVITPLTPKGLEALVPQPPPPHQPETQTDRTVVVQVLLDNGKVKLNLESLWSERGKVGPRLSQGGLGLIRNRERYR
jgi:biopolymer transport protein TolR